MTDLPIPATSIVKSVSSAIFINSDLDNKDPFASNLIKAMSGLVSLSSNKSV